MINIKDVTSNLLLKKDYKSLRLNSFYKLKSINFSSNICKSPLYIIFSELLAQFQNIENITIDFNNILLSEGTGDVVKKITDFSYNSRYGRRNGEYFSLSSSKEIPIVFTMYTTHSHIPIASISLYFKETDIEKVFMYKNINDEPIVELKRFALHPIFDVVSIYEKELIKEVKKLITCMLWKKAYEYAKVMKKKPMMILNFNTYEYFKDCGVLCDKLSTKIQDSNQAQFLVKYFPYYWDNGVYLYELKGICHTTNHEPQ